MSTHPLPEQAEAAALPSCLAGVERYYSGKIQTHGATALGADWNSTESQELRFAQLLKLCDSSAPFSLNDIGCGYGHLYACLKRSGAEVDYLGVDISSAMIDAARSTQPEGARFVTGTHPGRKADYSLASGIFNVRLQNEDGPWEAWMAHMLGVLDASSTRGFAFNCLTAYSDPERKREDLYYADPCHHFDYCKRHFSKNVALLHDYGLYEFTLLVRKTP